MPRSLSSPGFLIIGAQKCGTSWLHRQLSQHPGLYLPTEKDLEFFSYAPHLTDPGFALYQARFAGAGTRLAGDATASYFWTHSESPWCQMLEGFQRDIPGVVRQLLGGELRLIVCLRDPVERALSAWGHYLAHGELDPALPFREAARYGGIIDMGFYARHLRRWQSVFEPQQMLLLSLEADIAGDPARTLKRCHEFLGVDPLTMDEATLGIPVFAGPQRSFSAGGREINLPGCDLRVSVSSDELHWLRGLYARDQAELARMAGARFDYRTVVQGDDQGQGQGEGQGSE